MITSFHKELECRAGRKLQLKINDNRSTMLSVRWEPDYTKVSLHRMFLEAPRNVMESLVCYIRRDHVELAPNIKWYIDEKLKCLDYSHQIDPQDLCTRGIVYQLQPMYDALNREYFEGRLNLWITWFGRRGHRSRSRLTLGLYHDALKLIKIHRLLDSAIFPQYVVECILFHEMVHHVCPAYHDTRGVHHIHSKEFRAEEARYRYHHLAERWLKEHPGHLFKNVF